MEIISAPASARALLIASPRPPVAPVTIATVGAAKVKSDGTVGVEAAML